MIEYFDALELDICRRINALSRTEIIRRFFLSVSRLGDYPAYLIVGVACAALLEANAGPFIVQSTATALAGSGAYKLLKNFLVRERPFMTHDSIVCAAAPLDRYSFPSGHTMHAVSFAILFSAQVPVLSWIMVPFAALVAASRVVLGLHYPTDVIAGAALGCVLAMSSLAIAG